MLTTHYLEEADAQAERVLIIDHGLTIADDTADNLKADLAGDHIMLTVDPRDVPSTNAILAESGRELREAPNRLGITLTARFEQGRQALPRLLHRLDGAGVSVRAADVSVPTLDDVFLSLTGRSLREDVEVAA